LRRSRGLGSAAAVWHPTRRWGAGARKGHSQLGKQFTINFLTDSVNATVGEVKAKLNGDLWTVTRDNGEVYQVPLSAIEGG